MPYAKIALAVGLGLFAQTAPSGQRAEPAIGRPPAGGIRTPSSKPRPPLVIDRPQVLPAAELRRRRLIELCNSKRGPWQVSIKGVRLSAGGTDVDEIYGHIWVSASFAQPDDFRQSLKLVGWNRQTIWGSQENVNLGKYPTTALSTITMPGRLYNNSRGVEVKVHFDLNDEDDGRGGNDEYFFLGRNRVNFGYANYHAFPFTVPTCEEAPEFERSTQVQLAGRPTGTSRGNYVMLVTRVTWWRKLE